MIHKSIAKKTPKGSHVGFDVALHGVAAARIEEDGTFSVTYLKNPLAKGTLLERAMAMSNAVDPMYVIRNKGKLSPWIYFLQGDFSVIEAMQAYEYNGSKKVDPNDLMAINIVVGVIFSQLEMEGQSRKLVLPFEWKGNLKKSVTKNRIDDLIAKGELRPDERKFRLSDIPEARKEDAYDAIGLALYSRDNSP